MYEIVKSSEVCMSLILISCFQILLENDNSQDNKIQRQKDFASDKRKMNNKFIRKMYIEYS